MKKINFLKILFFGLLMTLTFSSAKAQEISGGEAQDQVQKPKPRPNLLRELGLTPDQMRAIRRLNAEKRAQSEEAQRKAAEARRNLDLAIYADTVNDDEVKIKLDEFQKAQAEVMQIRASVEYEIRKILTPEQVARFRELRERFAQRREEFNEKRQNKRLENRTNAPKRFNNRQNPNPNF